MVHVLMKWDGLDSLGLENRARRKYFFPMWDFDSNKMEQSIHFFLCNERKSLIRLGYKRNIFLTWFGIEKVRNVSGSHQGPSIASSEY